MTSVDISPSDLNRQKPTLTIQSAGHALHVFINEQYSGSAFGSREQRQFTFTGPVNLRPGTNKISLLSIAVGLPNVGFRYEMWKTRIIGPVLLNSLKQGKKDLILQKWSYQIYTCTPTHRYQHGHQHQYQQTNTTNALAH